MYFSSAMFFCSGVFSSSLQIGSLPDFIPCDLFSSQAEAEAGAEIHRQRGIADDFVVAAVEGVLDVGIGGDSRGDGIPSADIDADVSGGVVDVEAFKVRIRAAADETASKICAPTHTEIIQHQSSGVFGPAEKRRTGGQ
jgi:hypothetical protein